MSAVVARAPHPALRRLRRRGRRRPHGRRRRGGRGARGQRRRQDDPDAHDPGAAHPHRRARCCSSGSPLPGDPPAHRLRAPGPGPLPRPDGRRRTWRSPPPPSGCPARAPPPPGARPPWATCRWAGSGRWPSPPPCQHHPELLVLDEPTSGVAPLTRARLWDRIREQAATGTAVLVTTHYMDEARQADRLVLMAGGRVVARGRESDLVGVFPGGGGAAPRTGARPSPPSRRQDWPPPSPAGTCASPERASTRSAGCSPPPGWPPASPRPRPPWKRPWSSPPAAEPAGGAAGPPAGNLGTVWNAS